MHELRQDLLTLAPESAWARVGGREGQQGAALFTFAAEATAMREEALVFP